MNDQVKAFIIDRIQKNQKLPKGIDIEKFNYIDSGYVDSMGLVKFVVEIEAKFNIEILDSDIESDKFRTVGGLISIINKKLKG